jgi:hypothetical protein
MREKLEKLQGFQDLCPDLVILQGNCVYTFLPIRERVSVSREAVVKPKFCKILR